MALLTFLLFLSIGLHCNALTVHGDGLQSVPEATRPDGDVCQDCTKIIELLVDLLSNADIQKKIMNGLETVCDHLPPSTTKLCKDEVEKMFPLAINFISTIAKPDQVCKMLGLCGSCGNRDEMLSYFVNTALQAAGASENATPQTQCSFCIFLVKTLEDLLPKERTETAVIRLLEEICQIFPSSYRDQCETIISEFSKSVMDAVLSYATPEAICALIQLCSRQEAAVVDPCTLATYRCRDMQTALRCGYTQEATR
ncbi:hypothetical protein INR49_015221 [Caranx melampygus]|nr:hypothetical protein INR49_015221 [Caranx melampygus]